MAVVTTARGTGVLNTESRRVRDVSAGMYKLEPEAGPITAFASKLRAVVATDPLIEWFEDELLPRFSTLSADLTAGAATMSANFQQYFRAGDVWQINDKEIVLVTATPSGTGAGSVTITRGFGTTYTSGQSAVSGNRLRLIAHAAMEGDTSRALLSTQKVGQSNYIQEFKHPFQVTRIAQYTKTFGGKDLLEEQGNQLIEHRKDIEMAFLIGEAYELTTGTHPRRATRGIIPFLSTNVKDAGGTLTESEFEDFMRRSFRYSKKTKFFFGSSLVMTVINAWARGRLQTVSGSAVKYGVSLQSLENTGRKLILMEHPLLENDSQTDLAGLAGYGVIIDLSDLKLRYMGPKLALLEENIQANDSASRLDQYWSAVGLEAQLEKRHGLLKGVTD